MCLRKSIRQRRPHVTRSRDANKRYLQRRRNTAPRRWRCLVHSLGRPNFQLADLVEFSRLQPRIRNRQRITGDRPCLKLVFGMRALPYCDKKFSGFAADHATYLQGVAQVGMAALIERAGQTDPWLHRKQPTPAMQSFHRSRCARASRRQPL